MFFHSCMRTQLECINILYDKYKGIYKQRIIGEYHTPAAVQVLGIILVNDYYSNNV